MRSLQVGLFLILSFVGIEWRMNAGIAHQDQARASESSTKRHQTVQTSTERDVLKLPLQDPHIVILKSNRQLELYEAGSVVRSYRVGLGLNPVADKQREGDRATPEGEFYIFTKNPKSAYFLSLGISYPNIEDAERGLRDGLISRAAHDAIVRAIQKKKAPPQKTALGGEIYIHGQGAQNDWTWGCIALENEDIQELYSVVAVGTPVTIKP